MKKFLKLDSHQHFWKYDPEKYSWIEDFKIQKDFFPQDLKPILLEHGFDGCVAVQAAQNEEETEFLLQIASQHEFIKAVVGWIDLSAENVAERLDFFSENPKLKGVRHTVWDEKGEFMLETAFLKGISELEKRGLTYDILAFDYQLASAVKMVENFQNQKFDLDHFGNPDMKTSPSQEWISNIEKLAAFPNVFCKISGMFSGKSFFKPKKEVIFPFLDVVVENFGTDKLLFGSNWPVCLTSAEYDEVLMTVEDYFSNFSEIEKAKIFGNNAAGFYSVKK